MVGWDARSGGPMQLRLTDPSYTERLANFLRSLGQATFVAGPAQLEVARPDTESAHAELAIYLKVWRVLYPDTEVHVGEADDEAPAA
jgi:hypothetical protein